MGELLVKHVDFKNTKILAAQDSNNEIWVGVKYMCDGIGLDENHSRREKKRINEDIVLSKGRSNLTLPTNGGSQNVLCLKIDFVPLWLASIHITPSMKRNMPSLVDNLVEYKLQAKDVLANAFLPVNNNVYGTSAHYDSRRLEEKIDALYKNMETFSKIIMDRVDGMIVNEPTMKTEEFPEIECKDKTKDNIETIDFSSNDTGYEMWVLEMDKLAKHLSLYSKSVRKNTILNYVFEKMRNVYGIVWEQEIKDYSDRYNVSYRKITKYEVIYYNDMLKSLFESIIQGIPSPIERIMDPYIKKTGDRSRYNMVSYKKVYDHMEKNYGVDWKNRKTRFLKNGDVCTTGSISCKQIIESSDSLITIMRKSVDDLLVGN